jgi:hypothetical protein
MYASGQYASAHTHSGHSVRTCDCHLTFKNEDEDTFVECALSFSVGYAIVYGGQTHVEELTVTTTFSPFFWDERAKPNDTSVSVRSSSTTRSPSISLSAIVCSKLSQNPHSAPPLVMVHTKFTAFGTAVPSSSEDAQHSWSNSADL